jgi:hypothetical protein
MASSPNRLPVVLVVLAVLAALALAGVRYLGFSRQKAQYDQEKSGLERDLKALFEEQATIEASISRLEGLGYTTRTDDKGDSSGQLRRVVVPMGKVAGAQKDLTGILFINPDGIVVDYGVFEGGEGP